MNFKILKSMNKKIIFFSFLLLGFISNAQIGVGNTSPTVNLDARATTGNSAIAFGNTNQTATAAGAGAMKYDNAAKQMYYSDGTNWVSVAATQTTAFIPKVVASGRTTAVINTFGVNSGVNPFWRWTFGSVLTNDGNWNASVNLYTVATPGIYQFTLAGPVQANKIGNSTAWIVKVNGSNYIMSQIANGSNIPNTPMYGGGGTALYLTAGSTIEFGSVHCFGCGTETADDTYTIRPGCTFTITQLGT